MKAIVRHKYGSPDVLGLEEVPTPTPADDEVLIKVHATSINASDWELLTGSPLYIRLLGFGFLRPKFKILGSDIAGRIEAVGKNVKQFKPGDEVFGDTFACGLGGFAEYVCVPKTAPLVLKPDGITFEDAAAVPQAAFIALQGIKGRVQPGQRVLINGAGGGAGTFSVQFAKSFGAEVTCVDRAEKLEMLRSIGADHVIDYTQEDFTRTEQRYDLILDVAAHRSIFDHKRALGTKGTYLMAGGSMHRVLQAALLGPCISRTGSKKMGILAVRPNVEDLVYLTKLVEARKIVPVIDRHYPLAEVAEALGHLGEGHVKGKVVITV